MNRSTHRMNRRNTDEHTMSTPIDWACSWLAKARPKTDRISGSGEVQANTTRCGYVGLVFRFNKHIPSPGGTPFGTFIIYVCLFPPWSTFMVLPLTWRHLSRLDQQTECHRVIFFSFGSGTHSETRQSAQVVRGLKQPWSWPKRPESVAG